MREVAIVAAGRTAIGGFGGSLASLSVVELGIQCAQGMLNKADIPVEIIDEVIIGNVLGAGNGQNIARQIQIGLGIPAKKTAFTVNKVCGASLKTIALAAQAIMCGDKDVVLAGGCESMSNAAYIQLKTRWGARLGDAETKDLILSDGLTDAFSDIHMGITAENLAEKYQISREQQDEFALTSQLKAAQAIQDGKFNEEIIPVLIKDRKGEKLFVVDEHPRAATIDKLAGLKPAFKKNGSVTAGNASGINDGAAMVLLMPLELALANGYTPLAILKSTASAGVEPELMGFGPVPATIMALEKAKLQQKDINLVEFNEAFAAQALSVSQQFAFPPEIINVNGGAIALGHPIAASGARILVTLLFELKRRKQRYGLASLCIGGGMGITAIIENYNG
ncbi:thiolase family protein [Shewanella marina]|uniref:thiolase family protein n=1 Tax=Shewanella marina TaxID=487319 RepID=UPI000470CF20|nr:acetyl-CoA C-acetyltransferase [Shewanella marina]